MDIKNLEQAIKLQNNLTATFSQNLVTQRTGKMPAFEGLLKEKEQLIASAKAEVDAAIKDRDAATSRWDERVALRKANVAKLQKEMGDLKGQLTERKAAPKVAGTGKAIKKSPAKKPSKKPGK